MNIETIINKLQALAIWYQMPDDEVEVIKAAVEILESVKWNNCEYIKGKLKGVTK